MKKSIFLTADFSKNTGGVLYDENLFYELKKSKDLEIKLVTDVCFKEEYTNVSPDFLRFCRIYNSNVKKIFSNNNVIINSRLYTRFLFFPWYKTGKNRNMILIHHHFNFMTEHGVKRVIHKFFELRFLKKAKYIVTPNRYTMDICKQYGLENKMLLIEAASLENKIYKTEEMKKKQFAFIGTVEKRKGIHYAIEAFKEFSKKYSGYELIIVGGYKEKDSYYQSLVEQVEKAGLRGLVKFTNRVSDEEKVTILKESIAFVFPSQNEGYGWVMIEAMQYGLPVVAFNNTAMPYTVNESNGYLVNNQSVKEFCQAMCLLVEDKENYMRLRDGAYKTVLSLPGKEEIEKQYVQLVELLKK